VYIYITGDTKQAFIILVQIYLENNNLEDQNEDGRIILK
jgi:hypothetical protein